MEHPVEPPSWLPEGAASTVTDEATVASGQADAASEQADAASGQADAAGEQDSPNGLPDPGQEQPGPDPDPLTPAEGTLNGTQESTAQDADELNGQTGSSAYGEAGPHDYRQDVVYTPDYPSQSGYNDGVSPPVGEESSVPPYPAELPSQQSAAATSPGLAAAAYRALPKPRPKAQAATQARRANLVIARLEPWSVMKFSFLMSLVAWVVLFVAVALLYYALSGLGVFAAIQRTLQSVTSSEQSSGVNLTTWMSASRVLGYTMLIGAANIVLITALSTIGAVIYNLVTHLGGGIEVTLKETD